MGLISTWNKKVKNMDIWDIGLTKLAVFFGALCIVSLVPAILFLDWYVFLIIGIIASIRPLYKFLKD